MNAMLGTAMILELALLRATPLAEGTDWTAWGYRLARAAGAVLLGLVLFEVGVRILVALARHTRWRMDDILLRRLRRPGRLVTVLITLQLIVFGAATLNTDSAPTFRHLLSLSIIGAFTWLVVVVLGGIEESVMSRYDISVSDNLEARRVHTQVGVVTRTVHVIVIVIGIAVALMTFPRIRQLGTSLLASAGIAGLAIGLAARPVLENLIAGVQIALTQPIRLDDVVIIEGEWGKIEEIGTTYVVVRIWDERRLIVPFSHFIQQPFQNWTRTSAELLGTVFLHVDYRVSVDALRAELTRIVEASEHWDGRVVSVAVTDSGPQTMQVRALVSASDSGHSWDLRVEVREKLIDFLQREYPGSLPRTRVELPSEARSEAPGTA